ncbi:hypothetical protein LTS15_001706 [Exophiala xenobiotica]|nr:hypothetical protein LTS15_001706 [Exophiala xenobiotica]
MEEPDASIVSDATPDISSTPPSNDAEENTGEREVAPTKPKRHRGRQAKDPLGQSIQFKCNRREDLEQQLRDYLANPIGDPAHTTLEFSFPVTAAFSVPVREPKGNGPLHERTPYVYSLFNKTAVTVIDALHNIQDPREQMLTQKAIAKSIVEAVMEADGYHYSFHNNWLSREDQANRFSYFCNDSMLNKCRAVNGGAKIKEGVKIRKQIWECEGGLSVKFSLTKMSLELHYKHIPLHPTFEERAPPPRNGSKRRKLMEIFHPEKLPQPKRKGRPKQSTPPPRQGPKRRVGRPWKQLVTEPLPRPMSNTAPTSTREDSLQPLFDFLGSAEEAATATADSVGDGVESTVESEPPTNGADGAENNGGAAATLGSSRRPQLPGMMSGYMSGEQITWGHKKRGPYKKRKDKSVLAEAPQTTPSPPLQAPAATEPPSELKALKARLLEAEQKIKDLEAEKNKAGAPLTWNTPPLPPPQPPRPNNVPAYLPPRYHYPPPPPPPPRQWHDPRLPHPTILPSHGPFPQPTAMQHPGPDSMPHTPSPNPTVHENLPYYGFVPNVRGSNEPPPPRRLQPKPPTPQPRSQQGYAPPQGPVPIQSQTSGQAQTTHHSPMPGQHQHPPEPTQNVPHPQIPVRYQHRAQRPGVPETQDQRRYSNPGQQSTTLQPQTPAQQQHATPPQDYAQDQDSAPKDTPAQSQHPERLQGSVQPQSQHLSQPLANAGEQGTRGQEAASEGSADSVANAAETSVSQDSSGIEIVA